MCKNLEDNISLLIYFIFLNLTAFRFRELWSGEYEVINTSFAIQKGFCLQILHDHYR